MPDRAGGPEWPSGVAFWVAIAFIAWLIAGHPGLWTPLSLRGKSNGGVA